MADKQGLNDEDIKTSWQRAGGSTGGLTADPDSTDPDGTDADGTDGQSGDSDTTDN
ncbi:MAG TPA: hypothetical protein VG929_02625 [Actinomycetota bacterium]|nr:hypothetical protein [Actinomycetota bacterium]